MTVTTPFDKHQIFSLLEPLKNEGRRLVIVSPDKGLSRTLQVLLSAGGFDTVLFSTGAPAIKACINSPPEGIIIGTFQKSEIEEIISSIKSVPRTRNTPLFRIVDISTLKYAKPVSLETTKNKPGSDGLYKLIGEIEAAYSNIHDKNPGNNMEIHP